MKTNLLSYLKFLALFVRIKVRGLSDKFPALPGGVLDEQTALMRRAQVVLGEKFLEHVSPAQARANFRGDMKLLKSIGGIFEKVFAVQDVSIPGPAGEMAARLYLPQAGEGLPLFLFFHGGGWVIGDLETGDNMARFICKHAGCAVLSVDYRLAPEHPYPAAVEDACAALEWAVEHVSALHANPRRVLVGGDSAGGNLAAVLAQWAAGKSGPPLAGQVLFYPAVNSAELNTPSYKEFGEKSLGLPRRDVEWFLEQYLPNRADRERVQASPWLAKKLGGLAPALVVTAEFDVLRDEGEAYAQRLEQAGVKVRLMRCNGVVHGFLSTIGLIGRATLYFKQIALEIRRMTEAD